MGEPGSGRPGRAVVVAVDLTPQSADAVLWATHEFYRPGDTVHLVHVVRMLNPNYSIQHSYGQSSYSIPDLGPAVDERAYLEDVKEQIKRRFTDAMDACGIAHSLHLFVDSQDAPASAVCSVLFSVVKEVSAALTVIAAHNKASDSGWDLFFLGSVAEYAMANTREPLVVVRGYGPAPAPGQQQQEQAAPGLQQMLA